MTFSTLSMWFVPVEAFRVICMWVPPRRMSSSTRIGIIQPRKPHRRSWRQDRVAHVGHAVLGACSRRRYPHPLIVVISPILTTNLPYLSGAPTSSKSSAALTPLVVFCVLLPIDLMARFIGVKEMERRLRRDSEETQSR